MKGRSLLSTASLLSIFFAPIAVAQEKFTHPATGFEFWRQSITEAETDGGIEWGYALPPVPTGTNDEYIGYLRGSLQPGRKGWSGISHGGGMANSLLLLAYPSDEQIKTMFVFGNGFGTPNPYTGNASVTQIAYKVTDTSFELVYRCRWCWVWDQEGWSTGEQRPTNEIQVIGWAQHKASPTPLKFHNNGQGLFGIENQKARNEKYFEWIRL
ncbi:hypothetical protein B0J11DRAFT_599461 [Dendryphion nanum]|uniref:Cellobiose dehydrogenase-like cytochrome domain-containing protein n=1 Tax=Dendryphion nanum TaxID=256645 RepID=A0A9P9D0R8_9PLEO|nr:hypothetical protein B0J11DRAFT_599461 [Dendryphion nanum]